MRVNEKALECLKKVTVSSAVLSQAQIKVFFHLLERNLEKS